MMDNRWLKVSRSSFYFYQNQFCKINFIPNLFCHINPNLLNLKCIIFYSISTLNSILYKSKK